MSGETSTTVVGNLTSDPELRYTQTGLAVVNFTVASTARSFDRASAAFKDGDPLFLRCTAWRDFAENIAALAKGTRVVVTGDLKQRTYETKEGEKRTTIELEVTDIGASVRFAKVTVVRNAKQSASSSDGFSPDDQAEPWASSEPEPVGASK